MSRSYLGEVITKTIQTVEEKNAMESHMTRVYHYLLKYFVALSGRLSGMAGMAGGGTSYFSGTASPSSTSAANSDSATATASAAASATSSSSYVSYSLP